MEKYILVRNNIICDCFYNDTKKSHEEFTKLFKENELIRIKEDKNPRIGDSIKLYNKDFSKKSDKELLEKGLISLKEDEILENDYIRKLNKEERVNKGLDKLPEGFKVKGNEIIEMSLEEKYKEKIISRKEYLYIKEQELRNIRNKYLQETDIYVSIPDYPIKKEIKDKYLKYRQYLRDITKEENFPNIKILKFEDWNK